MAQTMKQITVSIRERMREKKYMVATESSGPTCRIHPEFLVTQARAAFISTENVNGQRILDRHDLAGLAAGIPEACFKVAESQVGFTRNRIRGKIDVIKYGFSGLSCIGSL